VGGSGKRDGLFALLTHHLKITLWLHGEYPP
jgi:hypothetical protein